MVLINTYRIPSVVAIITIIVLTTGCGGSDSTIPTQPSDSVLLDSSNTMDVANAVLGSRQDLGLATRDSSDDTSANESDSQFLLRDTLNLLINQMLSSDPSTTSVVSGVTATNLCNSGGTITIEANGSPTIQTGIITFADCNFNNQLIIDGQISYHLRIIDNEIRFNGFGMLAFDNLVQSTSYSIDMDFDEIFRIDTGDFKRSDNFAMLDYPDLGSFLVETIKLFEGNYYSDLLDTGQFLIYGDNNTQILISVNKNSASVKLDDGSGSGFVEIAGSPIYISP